MACTYMFIHIHGLPGARLAAVLKAGRETSTFYNLQGVYWPC